MSHVETIPLVFLQEKPKRKARHRKHSNPIRAYDLGVFFGTTRQQMEKQLQAAGVDLYDIQGVLAYVARRVITPYLDVQ